MTIPTSPTVLMLISSFSPSKGGNQSSSSVCSESSILSKSISSPSEPVSGEGDDKSRVSSSPVSSFSESSTDLPVFQSSLSALTILTNSYSILG